MKYLKNFNENQERTMYRVMSDDGSGAEMHTDDFHSEEDAQELADDLAETFPDYDYYVEPYEPRVPKPWETRGLSGGISGGVDGFEDMYPDRD